MAYVVRLSTEKQTAQTFLNVTENHSIENWPANPVKGKDGSICRISTWIIPGSDEETKEGYSNACPRLLRRLHHGRPVVDRLYRHYFQPEGTNPMRRYSIWKNVASDGYDIELWENQTVTIVQTNIYTYEKARRALADWQEREQQRVLKIRDQAQQRALADWQEREQQRILKIRDQAHYDSLREVD